MDAKTNPFLNKLPIPDVISGAPNPDEEQTPADQAFQNVTLAGVLKRGKSWIALLKMGDQGTEMVKAGDRLNVEGQLIKILAIREDALEFAPLTATKDPASLSSKTRTLFLPNIIGFGASSSSGAESSAARGGAAAEKGSSGGKGLSDIFKGLTDNLSDKSSEILNGLQEPN